MSTTEIPAGSIIVCNGPNGLMNATVSYNLPGQIVVFPIGKLQSIRIAPSDVVDVINLGEATEE